jgi:hypothetical protein
MPVVQPTKFELAINLNLQRRSASNARANKPCFFLPPGTRFRAIARNKTLLFLPRISGWRGVFTKLEYLILNHRFRFNSIWSHQGWRFAPPCCARHSRPN